MKQTTRILAAGMLVSLPLIPLAGRWLSDTPADTPTAIPGRTRNARGFFVPAAEESAFPRISVIQAVSGVKVNGVDESAVTVTWQDSAAKTASGGITGPFRFVVYRGKASLSRDSLLDGAEKLQVLPAGSTSYVDRPAAGTAWFYAVSVLDPTDTEYFKPEYDQTYTAAGVKPGEKAAVVTTPPATGSDPHIKDLNAAWHAGSGSVRLSWQYSGPFRPGLRIVGYRNLAVIDTTTLDKARVLGTVTPSAVQTAFSYKPDQAGRWYYAITSFAPDGRENRVLVPGVNATTVAVEVPGTDPDPRTNIVIGPLAVTQTNYVYVTNTIELYRTNTVTVETPSTHDPQRDIEARPLEADLDARPLPESIENAVYREIRSYLQREDRRNRNGIYQSIYSLRRLESLAAGQQLKDQCTLFIGRAYFNLGEFHTAFSVFSSLRDRLPEEARHWMRRASERMR